MMWDTPWQESVPGTRTEVTVPWEALWWSSRCRHYNPGITIIGFMGEAPPRHILGREVHKNLPAVPPWDSREAKGPCTFRVKSRKKKKPAVLGKQKCWANLCLPQGLVFTWAWRFQPFKRKRRSQRAPWEDPHWDSGKNRRKKSRVLPGITSNIVQRRMKKKDSTEKEITSLKI